MDLEFEEIPDVDPATLEIFKVVLESSSGKKWFSEYVLSLMMKAEISIRTRTDGIDGYLYFRGYSEIKEFQQTNPKDSWLKKWIKRQLI